MVRNFAVQKGLQDPLQNQAMHACQIISRLGSQPIIRYRTEGSVSVSSA